MHWPNGKRIAVVVTAMLETWSEGKPPPYSVQASPLKPGTVDLAGIAWGTYGGKVGVWRIIDLLSSHGAKGTFCVNGRSAELYPDAVRRIVAAGHEVAGHGWVQDGLMNALNPAEERATIARCLDVLEQTCGVRPVGWCSPVMAFSAETRALLAEAGLLWHGDARDVDLPRQVSTPHGPIAQIPSSDFTDNRVLRSSPMDLWDVYSNTFDYLYRRESPAFLALSLHCHFGGRPMVSAVFDKILTYIAGHEDVWFATYAEIARWVLAQKLAPETFARRKLT
jgi:peptidoglycan/xylan/chitin deacetylase (PgdA/CDA1 family)